jgi:hypothetical protein
MAKNKEAHDPFNPEPRGVRCPSCGTARMQCEEGETVRRCPSCGRVERWIQPNRKAVGNRRYQRLVARQQKKFGEMEMVLFQWVADPEPVTPAKEEDGD